MGWTDHWKGPLASLVAAGFWVGLAWRTPSSTHHFAPLVVAAVWGYVVRHDRPIAPTAASRLLLAAGGMAIAIGAQIVLAAGDKLNGPPLFSEVAVPLELSLMAVVGALTGSAPWQLLAGARVGSDEVAEKTADRTG